jgi:hypothetical protein
MLRMPGERWLALLLRGIAAIIVALAFRVRSLQKALPSV